MTHRVGTSLAQRIALRALALRRPPQVRPDPKRPRLTRTSSKAA